MKKIVLFISFIILLSCNQNKNNSIFHYKNALKEYKIKEYLKASKEIEASIKLDSSNNDKFLLKGRILNELELYNQSNIVLNYLLKMNYKKDTINYELSSNYFAQGNSFFSKYKDETKMIDSYEKSIGYVNTAIKLNPSYQKAYELKIKVLNNWDKYEEAISNINHSLELFPNNYLLLGMRGKVKYQLGDVKAALIDLTESIDSGKLEKNELSNLLRFRANIYYDKNRNLEAIRDLNQSISIAPKDEYNYWLLGDVYKAIGDKEKACSAYRKSADLGNVLVYEKIKELCGEN
jgi:tetratricopeptide (TPR) repeat protein